MPKVYLQKLIKILNLYENESRYKLTIIFSCLRQHKITLTTTQKSKNTCMCRVRNSNLFRVAHKGASINYVAKILPIFDSPPLP